MRQGRRRIEEPGELIVCGVRRQRGRSESREARDCNQGRP
jgi:hypothetical protein